MAPETDAPFVITKLLRKRGHSETSINSALKKHQLAAEGEKTVLTHEIDIIKWPSYYVGPEFDGPKIDPIAIVKIAYEFLALVLGNAIYDDTKQLQAIRDLILNSSFDAKAVQVETLHAPSYDAFHGIAFEGNDPHAKIQIRLFGRLAYRVNLPGIAINTAPTAYTIDLVSGDEWRD